MARQAASRRSNTSDLTILGSPSSLTRKHWISERRDCNVKCQNGQVGLARRWLAAIMNLPCVQDSFARTETSALAATSAMIIHVLRQPLADFPSPWLVLLLLEGQGELAVEVRDTALGGLLSRLIVQKELTGSVGELTVVHGPAGFAAGSVLIVGLGPTSKFDAGAAYAAGFALAKRLAGKPRES